MLRGHTPACVALAIVGLGALAIVGLGALVSSAYADDPGFAHQTFAPVVLSTDPHDIEPAVAVGADGTAYIAWLHIQNDTSAASDVPAVDYCRLPRGATACAVRQAFTTGTRPKLSVAFADNPGTVRVMLSSSGQPIVAYTDDGTFNPAGSDAGSQVYVTVSADGGASFPTPVVQAKGVLGESTVAQPAPDAISTIDAGGIVRYQEFVYDQPGVPFVAEADLIPNQKGEGWAEGSVAFVDATTPIVAFRDHLDSFSSPANTYWQVYDAANGPAGHNNASFWKPVQQITGEGEPQLASGPKGVFLQTNTASHNLDRSGRFVVRHYNGAAANTFGPPVPTTSSPFDSSRVALGGRLFEDASGGLHSVWQDGAGGIVDGGGFTAPLRYAYSGDGGQSWRQRTLEDQGSGGGPSTPSTAADGGGFVVHAKTGGGVVAAVIPTATSPGYDGSQAPGKPSLSGFSISPTVFRAANAGPTIALNKTTGSRIRYTDSAAASTTFTVLRATAGTLQNGHCTSSRPKHSTKKARGCTFYAPLGGFVHPDRAGVNQLHFSGRLRAHKLAPGFYQLQAQPRLAGQAGGSLTTGFHIIG